MNGPMYYADWVAVTVAALILFAALFDLFRNERPSE